ncbi:MAG: hypothetical protein R3212_04415, partial [Xanthomonadales bacterium]|nr:hypothetical protein [Xanthomonadales bacterium]
MTHRDRSEYKTRSSVKAVCKSVTIPGMTGHVHRNTQKVVTELIGAHRRLRTLRRADFLTLRDQLRFLPVNAHQLVARQRISVRQLVTEKTAPAIHPRTAKVYFELAKSLIRYAQDQEWIEHDITANLTFKTRNAAPPARRTYSHEMLLKLINGPVYTATRQTSWR